MTLVPIHRLLQPCREGRYAVGYFESWNLESLQGVIDAAEHTRSPVIIGFNGEFLSHSQRCFTERLALYAALGIAAADAAAIPCGLIFNECSNDGWVLDAADLGFNLVMPADPNATYDDYVRRLKTIVPHCHQRHVAVEAELGELPCGISGDAGTLTDPALAEQFVAETGVDLLAVSVGNVHIATAGQHEIDIDRLATLARRVQVPLVLHGGSGIAPDSLKAAIHRGIAKVNYGTYLKQRALSALQESLAIDESNPHERLGIGGQADLMTVVRRAVCDAVLERIGDLGCCGKA
jgi:ketose-bisphosphate aldolase